MAEHPGGATAQTAKYRAPMAVWDVVVVGAGACGLTVARSVLDRHGSVLVIDKGSRPGGRLASRKVDGYVVDTGCSSVQVSDPVVADLVQRWAGATFDTGVSNVDDGSGLLTWAFDAPANEVAARWAKGIERTTGFVTHVESEDDLATVVLDGSGERFSARNVVITAPAPQAAGIVIESGLTPPDVLDHLTYENELLLLACVSSLGHRPREVDSTMFAELRWGASGDASAPVVTARTHPTIAADTLGDDATIVHGRLLVELTRLLPGIRIEYSDLKRWRYARPGSAPAGPGYCVVPDAEALVIAGDALGNGTGAQGVERAVHSGLATVEHLSR